ncbi:MAG: helix-turn-helix transcriptional regulator [Oscillospiraceae bacterium]|nr:helix-turn-helix transcriptional regulator [Oscillospiraceae bacterium]
MEQTLGQRITYHRKKLGMTQEKMAEQLGVTAQAVSKWENDQSCPDITMLPRLADLFGITTDALLGRPQPEIVHQAEVVDETGDDDGRKFELEWHPGKLQAVIFAVWVLSVGGLCIANVIAQWNVSFWSILWPSFLLMLGCSGFAKNFNFFSCGCTLFGAYFLVANLGLWQLDMGKELIFPIIIVLFGLCLLADALRKPKRPSFKVAHGKNSYETAENKMTSEFSEDGENFTYSLSFGEGERIVTLPRLSGGSIDCSFGTLIVDLSGCGEIADRCHIDADCSFGEVILKVPAEYRVEPNSDTAFGDVNINGQPDATPRGIILLDADVSFGHISIKYI